MPGVVVEWKAWILTGRTLGVPAYNHHTRHHVDRPLDRRRLDRRQPIAQLTQRLDEPR